MPTEPLDPAAYVRSPMLDVASGVALCAALLAAIPKDASPTVKRSAKRLRKDALALQQEWAAADAAAPPPDRRTVDTRVDNAWAIALDRLVAYGALPDASVPKAARARELVERISPDRSWLKLPYAAEWAESEKRLRRIDDGLAADVDALAGKEFLAELRAAHAEYGAALGMKGPTAEAVVVNLVDPLRAVAQSIARYGRAVIGELDEDDAESVARARAALRPIDEHRAGVARRGAGASGGAAEPATPPTPATPTNVTPSTPLPEVK